MSFFCQGCTIHCDKCFNKTLQSFEGGSEFTLDVLNNALDVFDMFKKGYDGITLIGGECMDNLDFGVLVATFFKNRFPDMDIWIYSGYTYEEILKDKDKLGLLELCDVLVDGRFVDKLKDHKLVFRGSSNQRIIDIQKSLLNREVVCLND